jgi:hypothetical protein
VKKKIREAMYLTDDDRKKLAEWLTFEAVSHIIGKSRWPIHRFVKDGTLEKIGFGRSARISLKSVLAYIEQQRGIAEVARTVPNTSMVKAQQFARKKREEDKLARALELVNAGQATGTPSNPTNDPRLEACVFRGVCVSVAERDAVLDAEYQAQAIKRYTWGSVQGI